MSYARFTEDDLQHATDEVRAQLDMMRAEVMAEMPTCADRGVSDFDLSIPERAADILARHRREAIDEIRRQVVGRQG